MFRPVILMLIASAASLFPLHASAEQTLPYTLSEEDIAAAQGKILTMLIDPYSAVFEGIGAAKMLDQRILVCGRVNAKNKFGGYTGVEPYFLMLMPPDYIKTSSPLLGGASSPSRAIFDLCKKYNIKF